MANTILFNKYLKLYIQQLFHKYSKFFLCYLSMTDKYIYQIKNSNFNSKDIIRIFKCINIKLLFFFIFTFTLFIFYWYSVASFCAVYENSQITFVKDSFLSFLLSIIYPFIIYLITTALRICAIKKEKKGLKFVYILSNIIPFFWPLLILSIFK